VLIIPNPARKVWEFILGHNERGILIYLFGIPFEAPDAFPGRLAELAHANFEYAVSEFCDEFDE
jgi:hypothetical protein